MYTSKVIIFQVIITFSFCSRLSFNTPECNIYLGKFGTADNSDGSGASKIAFNGEASFIGTTSDVQVNIKYSDVDYFNDQTYFGLVQEDGKTPETTCLDIKLYKFNSNDYQKGIQVNDLKISASSNFSKQWRYYSFTILGTELATRTIQTSNSNSFIYKGYYGIAFYAAGTDQLQYTFYFDFAVTIDKLTGQGIDTGLIPLSLSATANCDPTGTCTVDSQATLKWCTDFTCASFTTPDLKFNDSFYLLQIITQQEMQNYYLIQTQVWYTGDGLNKKANILQSDNSQKGKVKLQLSASVAWTQVTLEITSVLSNDPNGRRRLLTSQSTFDTLSASSNIQCIKDQGSQTCSTCEQECKINGFSRQGCDFCFEIRLKLTLILAMLAFQFFV